MRAWLPLLALGLSAACGSSTEVLTGGTTSGSGGSSSSGASGGAASSSGSGGSGGACSPWSDPGGACAMTIQCVTPAADCQCLNGTVGCRDIMTAKPLDFSGPSQPPPDGACCDTEGLICGGYSDCGPVCRCQDGAWSCATPTACPPFTCPTTFTELLELHDQACPGHVGLACGTGQGCTSASCVCALDPSTGEAAWRCAATPC
ncbi:MAG: hypothetical protein QM820_51340 [Minicystis sp.]